MAIRSSAKSRVRDDILSGFVTFERARDFCPGVIFAGTELTDALAVDFAATERHRENLHARAADDVVNA